VEENDAEELVQLDDFVGGSVRRQNLLHRIHLLPAVACHWVRVLTGSVKSSTPVATVIGPLSND
jgi:hypothetical protein